MGYLSSLAQEFLLNSVESNDMREIFVVDLTVDFLFDFQKYVYTAPLDNISIQELIQEAS